MIFCKNQDEEVTISVLENIRSRLTEQDEYNAICFAVECLRQANKEIGEDE